MAKVRSTFRGAFCALALLVCSTAYTSTAEAQGVLRFVSGTGSDANNCFRPTPCRSLNRGVESAPDGAEVIVLDTAGYGPNVTINKSITITAPTGVAATIATPSGTSINITGGTTVALRNLTLIGQGTGTTGIDFSGGRTLHVENCTISGFNEAGIRAGSSGGGLFVKDTISRDNNLDGIQITDVFASIDNCRVERNGVGVNGIGIFAFGAARVTVNNTVAANNDSGFVAEGNAVLNAKDCVAANNVDDGFRAGQNTNPSGTPVVRVVSSMATTNGTGFRQTIGTFTSLGNNLVRGNTMEIAGTITVVAGN